MTQSDTIGEGCSIHFTPEMLDDLETAARFLRIANGFGHGPAAHCGKGERMAGFYYSNEAARVAGVMPAHSMGVLRSLILALNTLPNPPASATDAPYPVGGHSTSPRTSQECGE